MIKPTIPPVIKDAKNKPAFDFDCLTQIKDLDPNAPRYIEFDWELLRRNLGEAKEEMSETDFALVAQVMGELLRWIVKGDDLAIIGRRAVALAWVTNPEIFKGASINKLSRSLRSTPDVLHKLTAEASRYLGSRNRAQGHGWNFKGNGK